MSITAPALTQAREALAAFSQQKAALLSQLQEQSRKISDLEREVQKQAIAASQAQAALAAARIEIDALRTLVPDANTVRAFQDLVKFLASPAESQSSLRIAA